jgi:NAD(P)-dependent dehydrogenase (short-subunit alcohol dehydrogenase family)
MVPMSARTIALVTGANKGIGLETARQLAALGGTVLLGARDEGRGRQAEGLLRQDGADAHFVQLDVTDEVSVAKAAAWIEAEYGRLDILVNNAGTSTLSRIRTLPSETSLQDMRAVYEINVFGLVAVTNAMLPLLRRARAARIVNVSSEVGSISSQTGTSSPLGRMPASAQYPSSKTAVNMLTAMYAKELRDTPIKVNAANPGFTATDFTDNRGVRTAAEGAEASVHLATLPDDGPTGILWGHIWTTDGDGDGGYGPSPGSGQNPCRCAGPESPGWPSFALRPPWLSVFDIEDGQPGLHVEGQPLVWFSVH